MGIVGMVGMVGMVYNPLEKDDSRAGDGTASPTIAYLAVCVCHLDTIAIENEHHLRQRRASMRPAQQGCNAGF